MAQQPTPARYANGVATFGAPDFEKLRSCKILVVGAGGIGCELLKNLALVGCESLVVVDLDTIDVSNLNRQFLFRRKHVGQPKAVVAAEAVQAFNPRVRIEAIHANVKESRFDLAWFRTFDVAINALDNVDARRHVNRMCLATDTVLIEAGTTGFLGQVFCIRKGETACYECFPKPQRVVYPICTIRSTPSQPVHCVVWAKELFKLVFGDASASMLHEGNAAKDAGAPADAVEGEASTFAAACAAVRGAAPDAAAAAMGAALSALCDAEVKKQIGMDKYKTAAKVPKPLAGAAVEAASDPAAAPSVQRDRPADWDRRVWTEAECCAELAHVARGLVAPDRRDRLGTWAFDKDEPEAMRFVAAAANLRSRVFHIAPQSLYEAKGVAGNIVPAIATTNAVVAGLQVLELARLVGAKCVANAPDEPRGDCGAVGRYTYCHRFPTGRKRHLLQPTALEKPQQACYVCRSAKVAVALDTSTTTLRTFVDVVLKGRLGFGDPAVDKGDCGYVDSGDERLAANLDAVLEKLPAGGAVAGALLTVTDFSSDLEVTVEVRHKAEKDFDPKKNPELVDVLTGAAVLDHHALLAAAPAPAVNDENDAPGAEPPAKRTKV